MISQTTTWMSLAMMVTTAAGMNAGIVEGDRQVKQTEEVEVAKETDVQEEGQSYLAKSVLGSKVMIDGEVSVGTVDRRGLNRWFSAMSKIAGRRSCIAGTETAEGWQPHSVLPPSFPAMMTRVERPRRESQCGH